MTFFGLWLIIIVIFDPLFTVSRLYIDVGYYRTVLRRKTLSALWRAVTRTAKSESACCLWTTSTLCKYFLSHILRHLLATFFYFSYDALHNSAIIIGTHKCYRCSRITHTTSATNTVNVIFCLFRAIIVDNKSDIRNIQATLSNISSNQNAGRITKARNSLVTFTLL